MNIPHCREFQYEFADIKIAQKYPHTRPYAPPEGSARVAARGTCCWAVDRVSVDRVGALTGPGQTSGALTGSGQTFGSLTGLDQTFGSLIGSGQTSGSGSLTGSGQNLGQVANRVRDDVIIHVSIRRHLPRQHPVNELGQKRIGQFRIDRVGQLTGSG